MRRLSARLSAALLLGCLTVPAPQAPAASACAYLGELMGQQSGPAVLLPSYPQAPPGPLQQAAFLYDNAAAAIALVGCGEARQAHRIGAALLLALDHDRYWHDGRLRNAYAAGSVRAEPLKLAGWWDSSTQRWLEDDYQAGSDSGNLAWAVLALLTLAQVSPGAAAGAYTQGAERIARWLEPLRDTRGAGGFTGGSFGSDAGPRLLRWKSTEHNADLAAAFARLANATGESRWRGASDSAATFVEAMWDAPQGAFATGTSEDGVTRNPLRALDAQVWPLLALPQSAERQRSVLAQTLPRLRAGPDAAGYAYSEVGGGLWTEGTAQVLLLTRLRGQKPPAGEPAAIERARTANGGYYATPVAALPTGFMLDTDPAQPRTYLHLEHLGAAAWVALQEADFNPFTADRGLPQGR